MDFKHIFWCLPLLVMAPIAELSAQTTIEQQQQIIQQQSIQQQERERSLRETHEPSTDVRLPREIGATLSRLLPEGESPCFEVNQITLAGEDAETFNFSLADVIMGDDLAIGRCLGIQGINIALTRIQNAIIAKGFLTTRVLLSPQDLNAGQLVFTVIPGRIHTIRFAKGTSDRRGRYWSALPANEGDLLNLRDIEQALENFKRVPTAEADIQIEPAVATNAKPGDSDIVIRYQQALPFRITLSVDDGGSRATGKRQGTATLSGDNLLTLNDLFYFSVNHDLTSDSDQHGTRGHTLHYSLPFDYWLVTATTRKNNYHQSVAGANQTFNYSGESSRSELKIYRLMYRDAVRKTSLSLQAYLNTSHNYIDDTEIEVQQRRMAGWQANLIHKEFIGSATLDADLAYRRGTGLFSAMPAPEETFDEGTARPEIITLALSLSQPFTLGEQRLRYNGSWRGQWNKTPLIVQDRFSIGGRYTVRGFDGELTLSSERGWVLRNELGLALGRSGQELYLGFDYGQSGLHLDSHSRGGLTTGNALEFIGDTSSVGVLADTRMNFVGSAYNALQADNLLGNLQGRDLLTDVETLNNMVVQQQTHQVDFVGHVLGGNPATGGTIPEGSSFIDETLNIFSGAHTVHSCYGGGAKECRSRWGNNIPEYVPVNTYTNEGE